MKKGTAHILIMAGLSREVERIENGHCPLCNKKIDAKTFKNAINFREFTISGMCQECQDKTSDN